MARALGEPSRGRQPGGRVRNRKSATCTASSSDDPLTETLLVTGQLQIICQLVSTAALSTDLSKEVFVCENRWSVSRTFGLQLLLLH